MVFLAIVAIGMIAFLIFVLLLTATPAVLLKMG